MTEQMPPDYSSWYVAGANILSASPAGEPMAWEYRPRKHSLETLNQSACDGLANVRDDLRSHGADVQALDRERNAARLPIGELGTGVSSILK